VILLTECIFNDLNLLWPCFDSSVNQISDSNLEMNSDCESEEIIRKSELICLMGTNDQQQFESSVPEKQYFCHQFFD
jgi:hypothetical protein